MTEITELQHLTTERVLLARHKSGRQKSLAKLQGSKDTDDLDEKNWQWRSSPVWSWGDSGCQICISLFQMRVKQMCVFCSRSVLF